MITNWLGDDRLTHWGRLTHICVSKQTIIGSDNGLSPGRRQAIIWTNARILLIGNLGTNFSEILIENRIFSFKKMGLKVSSAKCLKTYRCMPDIENNIMHNFAIEPLYVILKCHWSLSTKCAQYFLYPYGQAKVCQNNLSNSAVVMLCNMALINSLRPRPNRRHFADDTFKRIFLNEDVGI